VTERPTERLDVPLAPVGDDPPASRRRRRRIAIVAIVAAALGWLAVTASGGARPAAAPGALPSGVAARPSQPATASPSSAPSGGRAAPRPPGLDLPEIPNVALPGAPIVALVVRDGDDARLVGWRAGTSALEPIGDFPGAFSGAFSGGSGGTLAFLGPDLASLVVSRIESATVEGADPVRVVTRDGVAWEADGVTALGGLAWSPAGDRFAIAGRHDRWLLVERRGGWATAADVDVSAGRPAGAASPTPGPPVAIADRIGPAAFSSSGEWVVGARVDPTASALVPAVRVRFSDGRVEPIGAFPIGGPSGLGPGPSWLVDVATKRTVSYGPNGDIPGGPPQLQIHEPDGAYAFGVRTGIVISWAWTGDGRLVVLGADGAPFPARWTLQLVERDGQARTLVEAPRASLGAFAGVRDGYAGLLLTSSTPDRGQLVVVRLADGTASAIAVAGAGPAHPLAAGWVP
jgi:hypothetical protein